jgi:hypothetical protein
MTSTQRKSAKLAALIKKTAQKLVNSPKQLQKLALTLPLLALFVEEVRAAQGKSQGQVFEDLQALTDFVEAQNLDEAQYAEIEASLDDVQLAANDVNAQDAAAVAEEETEKALLLEEEGAAAGKKKAGALLEPTGEAGAAGRGLAAEAAESEAAALAGEQAAAAGAAESFELAGLIIPVAPAPLFGAVAAGLGIVATDTGGGATDTETATGTTLSRTLKQLKTDGIAFVQPATGSNVINVELGSTGDALANTTGLTLFGDTDRSGSVSAAENAALTVNLVITNADQLAEVAALSGLKEFGIDSVRIDLSNQDLLNALTSDATLAADLDAIRASGLTVTTVDMGASASLTEAQAATLIDNGLSFAADDTITLTEAAGSTHLSTSLKDLQKLGVDAVSVSGTSHLSVDMGDLTTADLASGGPLPTFSSALNVTLDVTDVDQFAQATDMASQLLAASIDNVDMLVEADGTGEYAPAFTALSEDLNFRTDIIAMRDAGLHAGLDFGGKDVAANILIDEESVANLIADGLHFAANDHLTMEVVGHASGTHMTSSLKDLQKLGIDAVTVTSTGSTLTDSVVVDSGGLSAADLANGAVLPQFADALNVTLSVASPTEFNSASALANKLDAAHIDNVEVVLAANSQTEFDASFQNLINDTDFDESLAALTNQGINVGIDLNGADVSTDVTINQSIASVFTEFDLHYAANDFVVFEQGASLGTHLNTSLKDLQKLGVDAVIAAGSNDNLHVTLGTSDITDFSPFTPLPFFDPVLDVTLDVGSSTAEFALAADIALALHTTHVDNVKFDVTDTGVAGFADDLLTLGNNTAFTNDANALQVNMVGLELDLGGASTQGALFINEQQATDLIAAGVHFSSADHITLNASGTFHQTNLADLQKLGVDVVAPVVSSVQLSSLSSALDDAGANQLDVFDSQISVDATLLSQLSNFDWSQGTPSADLNDVITMVAGGVDVLADVRLDPQAQWGDLIDTLQASGLADVQIQSSASVHIEDELSAALYDAGMLHALPDAAIAIDAGANKVLSTSLKAMAELGVDEVVSDQSVDKLYVGLGDNADVAAIIAGFDTGSQSATNDGLFGAGKEAALVVDQTTFSDFTSTELSDLVVKLSSLGFTEIDVLNGVNDSSSYHIEVVAQTPVLSTVQTLGVSDANALLDVFGTDILDKKIS